MLPAALALALVSNGWFLASLLPQPTHSHTSFLTAENQPEIGPMFDLLLKSFRRMRKTKLWCRYVSGGAFVVEVTGEPGNWHVHLHVIIYNSYFPHKQLSALWNRSGGGTHIYIERLGIRDITYYLTGYLAKSEVASKNRAEVNSALKTLPPISALWFVVLRISGISTTALRMPCLQTDQLDFA